jgi:hypothetical protein
LYCDFQVLDDLEKFGEERDKVLVAELLGSALGLPLLLAKELLISNLLLD